MAVLGKFLEDTDPRISVLTEYSHNSFRDIDYVRGLNIRLHKELTIERGVVTKITYYLNASRNEAGVIIYDTPIVEELHEYTRNSLGLATERLITIRWYQVNDELHSLKKTRHKLYNTEQQLREGEIRRRNVIDNLKTKVLGLLQLVLSTDPLSSFALAQQLFDEHQSAIASYLETGSPALAQAVVSDVTHDWLNEPIGEGALTVRDIILSDLA